MVRTAWVRAALAFAGVALLGTTAKTTITVKGSDTMVILAQRWVERYMAAYPERGVQVTGGGSGTGFAALINGTIDICNASRPIKAGEIEKIRAKYGVEPAEIRVAVDGIAVYVHKDNPLSEITMGQLRDVYTGAITNWKQLGGKDARIMLYGRENSSGTFEFFREHVLANADYAKTVQALPGTGAVVHAVSKDRNGIGYGGAAYAKGVKYLSVRADSAAKAFTPTAESVVAGEYPISRFLYMYTVRPPEGEVKAFVDWVLSPAGQAVVKDVGYFPLPASGSKE